jgi:uncharacterized integral membrane protein (TIGR00698 family)
LIKNQIVLHDKPSLFIDSDYIKKMQIPRSISIAVFILCALFCLSPWGSSASALFLGFFVALVTLNPYLTFTKKHTSTLLGLAVMGLGAGMDLTVVARVGLQGVGYTVIGIGSTFILGTLLGKWLKVLPDTSLLITVGTAICGGSAIAAVAPVIRAKSHDISVSLAAVFMLNAVALFIFPSLGHFFNLSESQFGLWCALAIHDTSSVVGAALQFGSHAVQVAATVKLARALWIVPVAFAVGFYRSRKNQDQSGESQAKAKKPWFILGFIVMAALVTWIPALQEPGHYVEAAAKKVLILTLFFIGCNLTKEALKSVGFKPLVQAVLLWIVMASASLTAIMMNWIQIS